MEANLGAGPDDGIDRLRSKGRGFRRAGQLGGTSEAPSLDLVSLARSYFAVGGDART